MTNDQLTNDYCQTRDPENPWAISNEELVISNCDFPIGYGWMIDDFIENETK